MRERIGTTLASVTVKKLFNSFFTGDPLRVSDEKAQAETVKEFARSLKHLEFFRITDSVPYYSYYTRGPILNIEYGVSPYYRDANYFILYFDKDELSIRGEHYYSAPVSDAEQLIRFLDAVKKKYGEAEKRAMKRKKLLNLKDKAIESRVKILAQEMKFDYHLRHYRNKVKLTVRLDKASGIEIDIPYNKFQDVLSGVGKTIRNIAELYEHGLKFKVKPIQSVYGWVKYEDDNKSSDI